MPTRGSEFLPIPQNRDSNRNNNKKNQSRNPQSELSYDDYKKRKRSNESNRMSIGS
mgnify:CR=1 FL=1